MVKYSDNSGKALEKGFYRFFGGRHFYCFSGEHKDMGMPLFYRSSGGEKISVAGCLIWQLTKRN